MNVIDARLSKGQFIYSIVCFIHGSSLLTTFFVKHAGHDSWFAVILGLLFILPFIAVYILMANQFPGKNLFSINQEVFGKPLGKAVSSIYLVYFLLLASFNVRYISNFVVGFVLTDTPLIAVLVMIILTCCWAVKSGIEPIARTSLLFMILGIGILVITEILLINEMNIRNFMPVLQQDWTSYAKAGHVAAATPFGEIIVFMMILPSLKPDVKPGKPMIIALFAGALIMLLTNIRNISVLGLTETILTMPGYEVLRLIDIGDILTRMETLFALILFIMQFFKISILFYASMIGVMQIFELNSYRALVWPVGMLIAFLAYIACDSTIEFELFGATVSPFISSLCEALLPVITMIVMFIKKLTMKEKRMIQSCG